VGIGHLNTETPWEYPGLTPQRQFEAQRLGRLGGCFLEEQIIELLLVIATAPETHGTRAADR
jgi:hypothetical protein